MKTDFIQSLHDLHCYDLAFKNVSVKVPKKNMKKLKMDAHIKKKEKRFGFLSSYLMILDNVFIQYQSGNLHFRGICDPHKEIALQ